MKKNGFVLNKIIVWVCYLASIILLGRAMWLLMTSFEKDGVLLLIVLGVPLMITGMAAKIILRRRDKRQVEAIEKAQAQRLAELEERARLERLTEERRILEEQRRRDELEQMLAEEALFGEDEQPEEPVTKTRGSVLW